MVYIIFICFMTLLCSANGKEGRENQEDSFEEFCKDLNLEIDVHADSEKCTVAVYFELENSAHIDCFHFFDVCLITGEDEVAVFRVKYDDDIKGIAYHKFENVTSGVYNISIKPYCSHKKCPHMEIIYGSSVNITNNICISNRNEIYRTSAASETPTSSTPTSSTPIFFVQRKIFIIFMTCILLLIICILIHLARRNKMKCRNRIPSNHKDNINYVVQSTDSDIEVYIFHYYDRKGEMKKKVEIIKDFLLKLSYFSCVKEIEDELAVILFNVNNWLNDVLDESRKDGIVKRVILITSQEENEPDEDEIENQIYSAFLKKVNNTDEQCFTGNNNIYFVQLDNSIVHTVRFGNFICQHQYSLCGESSQDHIIDLCLNLCSGVKLDTHLVEKRIRELLMNHPVRHFGNSLKFVECV